MKKGNRNKGFSLIEFVVVMAIGAILVGLAAISVSVIHRATVTKAGNLISSTLSSARMASMAHGTDNGKFTLAQSGGIYTVQIGDGEPKPIGNSTLELYIDPVSTAFDADGNMQGGTKTGSIIFSGPLEIEYEVSGAIKSITCGGIDVGRIVVTDSHRSRAVEIFIYQETGKHIKNVVL